MSPSRLSRLTFALLLMALALAGVLAHQAQRTARSHRATAERTLRSYAQIAAWAVGNEVRQDLLALNHTTLAPVGRAELGPDGRPLPHAVAPLPQVRDAVTRQERLCGCTLASLGVFWFDFRAGALATDGAALGTPAARRWVTDTLRALVRDMPQTFAPTPIIVRSPQGYPRLLGYTATHLVQASAFGVVDGRPVALVLMVRRTVAGDPVLAFGYATDPQAHVGAVAERVLRKRGLLPPVLLGGAPPDSVLALRVADGAGRPLWRTRLAVDARYAAVDTLEPRFGAMRLHLALNPVMADRLVIGGLPRSRLPLLVALLAVTSGLVVVAVLQLRRQQELARMRTDFVSGVSHELRTPLAQIRLLAELLHLGKPEHEAGRRRAARIIDQEARRLTYLVENVLAFSRSEHGTTRVAAAATDVGAVAGEVLEMFAPIAAAAGARVTLRADGGACAQADEAAVRQILLNFLDNAARYGPAGQTIVVDVRATGVGAARGAVRLSVEDEGPGVPAAERGRVWEPYYRLERDAVVTGGGSGIGLAVVRDLVRRQGARTWIEDGRRGGARFVVELPAASDAATADAALDDATRAPAAARGAPWARGEGR